jgi:phosphohistidine phosphatase
LKTLHLLRHAKAAVDPDSTDHARPLVKRGIKAAEALAAHLTETGFTVDRVFCSTAQRARQTYELVAPSLGRTPIAYRDRLYLIDPDDMLDLINGLPDTADRILLIGHNPTFHGIALALTRQAARGHADELAALQEKYPTTALCSIQFDVDNWRSVKLGTGTLTGFVRPRDLE